MNNYYLNERHFVDEVGTVFYVNCGVDVSSATTPHVLLHKPDGTVVEKDATVVTFEGSKNYVSFSIASGDFDQAGDFTGQVWLTLGPWTGGGKEFIIHVDERLSSSSSSSRSSSSSASSS